jgi:hypothetical protein
MSIPLKDAFPPLKADELTMAQLRHLEHNTRHGNRPEPYRVVATPHGEQWLFVYVMSYGKGRLCISDAGDITGYHSGFCYATPARAFAAADAWDGIGEPTGWFRNLQTREYDRANMPPGMEL